MGGLDDLVAKASAEGTVVMVGAETCSSARPSGRETNLYHSVVYIVKNSENGAQILKVHGGVFGKVTVSDLSKKATVRTLAKGSTP